MASAGRSLTLVHVPWPLADMKGAGRCSFKVRLTSGREESGENDGGSRDGKGPGLSQALALIAWGRQAGTQA